MTLRALDPSLSSPTASVLERLSQLSLRQASSLNTSQAAWDGLTSGFAQEATNGRSLAAMMAGGLAYRLGRMGMMSLHAASSAVPVSSLVSRGVGLIAEVSVFEGVNAALSPSPPAGEGRGEGGFWNRWRISFVQFGLLKMGGAAAMGQNIFVQHLFQDAAMVAGHQVTSVLGLTPAPEGDLGRQFLHAEATNLQIGAGMALAHHFFPAFHALERSLEASQAFSTPSLVSSRRYAPDSSAAPRRAWQAFRDAHWNFFWMLMGMGIGGGGIRPKRGSPRAPAQEIRPVPELPASVRHLAQEDRRDGFEEDEVLEFISERLIQKHQAQRNAFLPEEGNFLLELGHHWLDRYEQDPARRYFPAFCIFQALNDVPGLRRTARLLEDDNIDKRDALMLAGEYEEAFRIFDIKRPNLNGMEEGLFYRADKQAIDFIRAFVCRRGYQESDLFFYSLDHAIDLATLASSYDLVISIARGGLFSGALSEMLGMETRVIEIHAHERETPVIRWIDPIRPEEIAGRRILFVDKDAVSGATLREAHRLFSPYHPAALGAYFNHDGNAFIPPQTIRYLRDLGFTVHTHEGIRPVPSLPVFNRIHEALKTPQGILRQVDRTLEEILPPLEATYPNAAESLRQFADEQRKLFFNLHSGLPGVEEVRELIALRLQGYLNTYREIRSLGEEGAAQHLINLVKTSSSLPLDFAQLLARGRYHGRALDLAKEREVENPHFPASYTASFRSAQQALRQKYDVALIVGPEGFAYEPIFEDLGLPSIAVNIPEADFNGPRSFQSFDDLSALKGKRVLVVEDDVQSGATLRALLEALAPHAPSFLGLYLGAPPNRQITANIPKAFKRVVVTQIDEALDERAFMRHLQRRETVFIGRRGR